MIEQFLKSLLDTIRNGIRSKTTLITKMSSGPHLSSRDL
jgi:hypothetical protein